MKFLPTSLRMRSLFIFLTTFLLIIGSFLYSMFYPYFVYLKAINKGYISDFLNLSKTDASFWSKGEFIIKKNQEFFPENEKNWKIFHFKNFEIPLPIENPVISFFPSITTIGKMQIFGGTFNNEKGVSYFSFHAGQEIFFDLPFDKQKIFNLPVFKEFLEKIPRDKIFEMVFTKNIEIKNIDVSQKIKTLRKLWAISYQELVLNLFILQIRKELFPHKIKKFSWYLEKKIGLVEQMDDNPGFYKEVAFLLEKGKIYTLSWRLPINEQLSDNIRFRILKNLKFKKSYPEAFISAYNDYRSLSLDKKVTITGFTTLYSALTHDSSNKNIFWIIVRDLKRGKGNEKYLDWLYDYGKKHLNIDLNNDQNALNREKIEKEKAEKLEKELKEAAKIRTNGEFDQQELSKDEKIQLFLRDAKKNSGEIEENERILIEN